METKLFYKRTLFIVNFGDSLTKPRIHIRQYLPITSAARETVERIQAEAFHVTLLSTSDTYQVVKGGGEDTTCVRKLCLMLLYYGVT
jgi:hypothetical protein